ncbi:MAG: c-type cytochrome [Acidimicrobiales bacterium]
MRHTYTNRLAATMTVLLLGACVVFAFAAVDSPGRSDRVASILEIEPDLADGRQLYIEGTTPPCAQCHALADAGADADRASDLDRLGSTRREVVVSIVGGQIGAHEAQGYRIEMTDRQIADLAAYIEDVAGG